MALTTRAKVKSALGLTAAITIHDAEIDEIVGAIDQTVFSHVSQALLTQRTVFANIEVDSLSPRLRLPEWPVISVTAITDGGSAVSASDYVVKQNSGYVEFKDPGRFWTMGVAGVSATFVAGITDSLLSDINRAATVWAAGMFNTDRRAGLNTERLGTYTYRIQSDGIPPQVRRALARVLQIFE